MRRPSPLEPLSRKPARGGEPDRRLDSNVACHERCFAAPPKSTKSALGNGLQERLEVQKLRDERAARRVAVRRRGTSMSHAFGRPRVMRSGFRREPLYAAGRSSTRPRGTRAPVEAVPDRRACVTEELGHVQGRRTPRVGALKALAPIPAETGGKPQATRGTSRLHRARPRARSCRPRQALPRVLRRRSHRPAAPTRRRLEPGARERYAVRLIALALLLRARRPWVPRACHVASTSLPLARGRRRAPLELHALGMIASPRRSRADDAAANRRPMPFGRRRAGSRHLAAVAGGLYCRSLRLAVSALERT